MLRSQRGHPQVVNPGFSDLEPKNGSQGRALARPGPHFAKTGAHNSIAAPADIGYLGGTCVHPNI
jgi:hypothetical protein